MQRLNSQMNDIYIQHFGLADSSVIRVAKVPLYMGVETEKRGARSIVLFVQTHAGVFVVDQIWREDSAQAKDAFFWEAPTDPEAVVETREGTKERLESMGFDPGIVDNVFPPTI